MKFTIYHYSFTIDLSDSERSRTSNLLIRSQVLYPIKLRSLEEVEHFCHRKEKPFTGQVVFCSKFLC